jgi:DNA topoisomerase-1
VGGSAPYAGTMAEHFAEPTKDQLSALKLPPAWTHVRVNTDPDAALVAVGKDKKGRTQYRYSAAHSEAAAAEKFERMKSFEKALPTLRSATEQDVDHENEATREAAVVTRLIDKTGFRIGSDEDTLASKKAYGATTLQARHVMVSGDTVTFAFSGKKGVPIRKTIEDPVLARVIGERLQNLKSRDPLFKTSDKAVRDYMAQHAPGHTPKDFRTRHATAMALDLVKRQPKPSTPREAKQARLEIAKKVSEFLGNTPTVALASYINPVVFAKWKAA